MNDMNETVIFSCSDCKHKLPITKLVDMDFKFCPYCGKPYRRENSMKLNLLSFKEANKLPVEILNCKASKNYTGYKNNDGYCYWWIRSAGYRGLAAYVVSEFGTTFVRGGDVNEELGVRPALSLEFDISSLPRDKEDNVLYGNLQDGTDIKWIDISEYLGEPTLLMKECLPEARRFDKESTVYETSEIKQYLESLMATLFA